mgnify:CR=1 FL=1
MRYLESLEDQEFEARTRVAPVIQASGPVVSGDPWFDKMEQELYQQLAFEADDGKPDSDDPGDQG